MTTPDSDDPAPWRDLLLRARAEVLATLRDLDASHQDIVDSARDSNLDDEHDPEGMTIGAEREMVAALSGRNRERLAEIDAALTRLAEGGYGRCAGCGKPIPPARLQVRPAATHCVDCATHR